MVDEKAQHNGWFCTAANTRQEAQIHQINNKCFRPTAMPCKCLCRNWSEPSYCTSELLLVHRWQSARCWPFWFAYAWDLLQIHVIKNATWIPIAIKQVPNKHMQINIDHAHSTKPVLLQKHHKHHYNIALDSSRCIHWASLVQRGVGVGGCW